MVSKSEDIFEFVAVDKTYTNGDTLSPVERFIHAQRLQKDAYGAIVTRGESEYVVDQRGRKERINPRWFGQNGTTYYTLKHGNRVLTFKGSNALRVGDISRVPAAIDWIKRLAETDSDFRALIEKTSEGMKRKK